MSRLRPDLVEGPVFASQRPLVLVGAAGLASRYLDVTVEWGWACTCGEARRGIPGGRAAQAARSAEDHFWWHQRTGRV